MLYMFKRLKRLYTDSKRIRFLKNEIKELRDEQEQLKRLFKEGDKDFNRFLNKRITSRYKEIFELHKKINDIREEMYD